MNWFRLLGVGLAWLVVGVCCAYASDGDEKLEEAETVVIPLDQIWALGMPRTKEICRLEPEVFFMKEFPVKSIEEAHQRNANSLILQMRLALKGEGGGVEKLQRRGFVVEGRGIDALRAFHRVLVKKEAPQTVFRAGTELSLCFYSLTAGTYVQLRSAIKQKNRIELHYHFQVHFTSHVSNHFSMIPLTYSDKGKVAVEMIQDPNLWRQPKSWKPGDPMIYTTNEEWGEDLICRPFSFEVE